MAATHNAGKLREIRELLRPYGVGVLGAVELGLVEPDETGRTFRDNAELKATAAAGAKSEQRDGRQTRSREPWRIRSRETR